MSEMIACCGIDCEKCPALVARRTNDQRLREKTAAEWSKMFGHEFRPAEINCTGCPTDDGPHVAYCETMCEIRKCARSRTVDNCALCADYACAVLSGFFKNVPPDAKVRLDRIRAARQG